MRAWLILFGAVLIGYSHLTAAAVYKWLDNKGNVHYSQTPPPVSEKVTSTIKINSQTIAVTPVRNGNEIFCGQLSVMEVINDDNIREENIRLVMDAWVAERDKLDQQRLNLTSNVLMNVRRRLDKQYAEYDCRVRWAHDQLKVLHSFSYKSEKSYQALEKEYNRLKARQDEECSTDPKKLGKTMLVGKEANEWGKCYDNYRYKMRDIKAKMKENRQSLRQAQ